MHPLFTLARESVSAWIDDYAPSMGAALAYYTLFSLAPLFVIVTAAAGMIFGRDAVEGAMVSQLAGVVGEQPAAALQALVASASTSDAGGAASILSTPCRPSRRGDAAPGRGSSAAGRRHPDPGSRTGRTRRTSPAPASPNREPGGSRRGYRGSRPRHIHRG